MELFNFFISLLLVFININYIVESKLLYRPPVKKYIRRQFSETPSGNGFPTTEGDDPGKPLYLTPYIEAGKIKKAQKMSKVKPDIGEITSYSGYLTVNKTCGSNLFFWYFPAQDDSESAPVVLWLQGGPGGSSMYGLFEELGPFNSFPEGLKNRTYSWNVKNNLLFIDQPVGTGYSFTKNGCYATNQNDVARDLYEALCQFFQMRPELQNNKFFITGESYAGHYIPAIGYAIHTNNPTAKVKINLSGMMIGDGWTDPREQIDYADYLYQTGLIDDNIKNQMQLYQNQFVKYVDSEQWSDAYSSWNMVLELFNDYSAVNVYNYLPQSDDRSNWNDFIQTPSTRKAIHVGSLSFDDDSEEVYNHLMNDMPKSVKLWVEKLLEHYPIVFYVGQVDVICAYPMVINFLRSLQWSGQDKYINATRELWFEDGKLAGYFKGGNNLIDVLVRDAGHMVPSDQPLWAYQLVNAFTHSNITSLTTRPSQLHPNDIHASIHNK